MRVEVPGGDTTEEGFPGGNLTEELEAAGKTFDPSSLSINWGDVLRDGFREHIGDQTEQEGEVLPRVHVVDNTDEARPSGQEWQELFADIPAGVDGSKLRALHDFATIGLRYFNWLYDNQ